MREDCWLPRAGYLVGAPSLRLKGDYLAIVTLSANELIRTVIRVTDVLGGPRGLGGIPKFTTLEVVFVFAIVSVVLMRNYLFSSHGRSMKAVRDSEIAAEAMGINTTKQKVFVFVFSAFFAGVSGGVFAHLLQFIHPDNFSFVKSLEYLIYLYVGGSTSISGAIVGPAIFTLLPELHARPAVVAPGHLPADPRPDHDLPDGRHHGSQGIQLHPHSQAIRGRR